MPTDEEDRCARYRRFEAIHGAFVAGDVEALRVALGDPDDFPNGPLPFEFGMGDSILIYALGWSPYAMLVQLLALGADADPPVQDGFPSLISVLSVDRADRNDVLALLLDHGADPNQRGINDWTPLHYAVAQRDLPSIELLLARGADPSLRTRIDECSTPLEDANAAGFTEASGLLRGR